MTKETDLDLEIQEVLTDSGIVLKVQEGVLSIDDTEVQTKKDYRQLRADVYSVPVEYRESGYFVGYSAYSEPKEIPASSEFTFIGSINVPADPESLLEQAKKDKESELNNAYEYCTVLMKATYPESERESWSIQAQEAALFLNDPEAETPWLDSASESRGVTKEEMAQLIDPMDKVYRINHGSLTGTRQRLRDEIWSQETLEDVQLLDVTTELKEAKDLMKSAMLS